MDEAIDLINVAFEQKPRSSNAQTRSGKKRKEKQSAKAAANIETTNFSVPDRLTGIAGLEELRRINPARQWNLIEVSLRVMMRLKPSLLGRRVDITAGLPSNTFFSVGMDYTLFKLVRINF